MHFKILAHKNTGAILQRFSKSSRSCANKCCWRTVCSARARQLRSSCACHCSTDSNMHWSTRSLPKNRTSAARSGAAAELPQASVRRNDNVANLRHVHAHGVRELTIANKAHQFAVASAAQGREPVIGDRARAKHVVDCVVLVRGAAHDELAVQRLAAHEHRLGRALVAGQRRQQLRRVARVKLALRLLDSALVHYRAKRHARPMDDRLNLNLVLRFGHDRRRRSSDRLVGRCKQRKELSGALLQCNTACQTAESVSHLAHKVARHGHGLGVERRRGEACVQRRVQRCEGRDANRFKFFVGRRSGHHRQVLRVQNGAAC